MWSLETHQLIMAFWQPHPITVSVLQAILVPVLGPLLPAEGSYKSASDRNASLLKLLRSAYVGIIGLSALHHIPTLTLIFGTKLYPTLFAPATIKDLTLTNFFVPTFDIIPGTVKKATILEAADAFVKYDYYISSLSAVVWALVLHKNASNGKGFVKTVVYTALGVIAGGPVAAVGALLWARDETVLGAQGLDEKKLQ
jgi:hypothetical protein